MSKQLNSKQLAKIQEKSTEAALSAVKGAFESPEFQTLGDDELGDVAGGGYAEAVASGVASGVAGAIVTSMIPGPGIPG